MKHIRIAFLITQISGGGAERVVTNLANKFAENNIDVVLITKKKGENEYPLSEKVKRFFIESCEVAKSKISRITHHVSATRKILVENKIDVVLSFMTPANYLAIFATIGLNTKHVLCVRNDPDYLFISKIERWSAKMLFPMADGAVFQTVDAQSWFPERLKKKSIIIFNPVKEMFYQVNYNPIEKRVVTCGRLTDQKNHHLLISAFKKVVSTIPDAKLHIYGEGELYSQLSHQINELGLEDSICLEGKTRDVPSVLSKASLFVLSSDAEGAPNALMEAMAVGVPCISTDCPCGGPKMLFEGKNCGILIPIRNEDELSESICYALLHPRECAEMGVKAKLLAQDFHESKVYDYWLEYIKKICS